MFLYPHFQLGWMAHCAYNNDGVRWWVWICSPYLFVSILKIIYFLLSVSMWILTEYGNTIWGISGENWENNFTGILYIQSHYCLFDYLEYLLFSCWSENRFVHTRTYICTITRQWNRTRQWYHICKRNCVIREKGAAFRWMGSPSLLSHPTFNKYTIIIVTVVTMSCFVSLSYICKYVYVQIMYNFNLIFLLYFTFTRKMYIFLFVASFAVFKKKIDKIWR